MGDPDPVRRSVNTRWHSVKAPSGEVMSHRGTQLRMRHRITVSAPPAAVSTHTSRNQAKRQVQSYNSRGSLVSPRSLQLLKRCLRDRSLAAMLRWRERTRQAGYVSAWSRWALPCFGQLRSK